MKRDPKIESQQNSSASASRRRYQPGFQPFGHIGWIPGRTFFLLQTARFISVFRRVFCDQGWIIDDITDCTCKYNIELSEVW